MKTIYLIRHGESEGNASAIRLDEATGLTDRGRAQAAAVAERCAKLPVEALVASAFERARQTAEIIGKKIGREPEYSDLFVERRFPSDFIGKPKEDPAVLKSVAEMHEGRGVPGYRFSDEEIYEDLKDRAGHALDYLANHAADHILVVTHGFFMRIMAAHILLGEEMTRQEYARVIGKFSMNNAGISVFKYDTENKFAAWHINTWNDRAHLG